MSNDPSSLKQAGKCSFNTVISFLFADAFSFFSHVSLIILFSILSICQMYILKYHLLYNLKFYISSQHFLIKFIFLVSFESLYLLRNQPSFVVHYLKYLYPLVNEIIFCRKQPFNIPPSKLNDISILSFTRDIFICFIKKGSISHFYSLMGRRTISYLLFLKNKSNLFL